MKRLVLVALFVMVLGFTTNVNATLINNGGNFIYDTDLDVTFYNPVQTSFPNFSWAQLWIRLLNENNFAGVNDNGWQLPTANVCEGYYCPGSEMGHLFFIELGNSVFSWENAATYTVNVGPFTNLQTSFAYYWSGTLGPGQDEWYIFDFETGHQGPAKADPPILSDPLRRYYAMAMHPHDIGPNGPITTPEPATMLLLGLGLVGLAGARRKFKN